MNSEEMVVKIRNMTKYDIGSAKDKIYATGYNDALEAVISLIRANVTDGSTTSRKVPRHYPFCNICDKYDTIGCGIQVGKSYLNICEECADKYGHDEAVEILTKLYGI